MKPTLLGQKFLIVCITFFIVAAFFIWIRNKTVEKRLTVVKNTRMAEVKGLKIEDIKVGTGEAVKDGNTVVINYRGNLEDGTEFDSSYKRGTPFETPIGAGRVIKGWDLGVVGMKVGGKRKLTIPFNLAYGEEGIPGTIPPRATLIFILELLEIKK